MEGSEGLFKGRVVVRCPVVATAVGAGVVLLRMFLKERDRGLEKVKRPGALASFGGVPRAEAPAP